MKPYFPFLRPAARLPRPPAMAHAARRQNMTGSSSVGHSASEDALSRCIPADPAKLALFQLGAFRQNAEKTHPNVTIQVKDDGIHLESGDRSTLEQMQRSLLDHLGQMVELCFTSDPGEAEFFARRDVKERLQATLSQTEPPAAYAVSGSYVTAAASSLDAVSRACSFLNGQLGHFSILRDPEYDCRLSCREWPKFLQTLGLTSVKVSKQRRSIDAVTLAGMEDEKRVAILEYLSAPLKETFVSMEPGMLKYIQVYYQLLLANMDGVSIVPVKGDGVCGLKV